MIYLGFMLDYLIMILLPTRTSFIINDIENNRLFSICLLGVLLDIFYHKILFYLIMLCLFYFLGCFIKVKKRYRYIKNILFYILFFSIGHMFIYNNIIDYGRDLSVCLILEMVYYKIYNKLLN